MVLEASYFFNLLKGVVVLFNDDEENSFGFAEIWWCKADARVAAAEGEFDWTLTGTAPSISVIEALKVLKGCTLLLVGEPAKAPWVRYSLFCAFSWGDMFRLSPMRFPSAICGKFSSIPDFAAIAGRCTIMLRLFAFSSIRAFYTCYIRMWC